MPPIKLMRIAVIALAGLAFSAGAAWSFDEKPFDQAAFEAAQSSGKPDAHRRLCALVPCLQGAAGGSGRVEARLQVRRPHRC